MSLVHLTDVCWLETWRDSSNSYKYDIPFVTMWWLGHSLFLLSWKICIVYLFSTCLILLYPYSIIATYYLWWENSELSLPFCFLVAVLSVDAIDMSGKHEVDLDTNMWKVMHFLNSLMLFSPKWIHKFRMTSYACLQAVYYRCQKDTRDYLVLLILSLMLLYLRRSWLTEGSFIGLFF